MVSSSFDFWASVVALISPKDYLVFEVFKGGITEQKNTHQKIINFRNLIKTESNLIENERDFIENERGVIENERDLVEHESNLIENESGMIENESNLIENEKGLIESSSGIFLLQYLLFLLQGILLQSRFCSRARWHKSVCDFGGKSFIRAVVGLIVARKVGWHKSVSQINR